MGEGALLRRPAWAGVVVLLATVVVLGLPPVRLWLVTQVPPFALLEGIQLPGPLPTLGPPLADDPSWGQWAARSVGALTVPAIFAAWMSRSPRRAGGVAVGAWATTVVAVVAGGLVHAVLQSVLMTGGFVSFLRTVGGVLLVGVVTGAALGVLVALVCAAVSLP